MNEEPSPRACQGRWFTRRQTGYLLLTGAVISVGAVARLVDDQRPLSAAEGREFIQRSGDRLIAILDGPGDQAGKRRQLQALISETMDIDGIARFTLGRFWNTASNEQRDEYVRLFPIVLFGTVTTQFGSYQGVRFSMDRVIATSEGAEVATTVFRPTAPMQQVVWVLAPFGGRIKIVDIVAARTSMRIWQRDDCANFLAHNNYSISALLESLRRANADLIS